jgi:hypothetical protein
MARQVAVSSLLAQERAGGLPAIAKNKIQIPRLCAAHVHKDFEVIFTLSIRTFIRYLPKKQYGITIGPIFLKTSAPYTIITT